MNFNVVNYDIIVCNIELRSVALSSLFLIGDCYSISVASVLDTPPDSLFIEPVIPLSLT